MASIVYIVEIKLQDGSTNEIGPFDSEREAKEAAMDHYVDALPSGSAVGDMRWQMVIGVPGPFAQAAGNSYSVLKRKA